MGVKGKVTSYIEKKIVKAFFHQVGYPYYNGGAPLIYDQPYNGEKTPGELGAVKNYIPDFQTLSARSWQAYTESDIAQLTINNYLLWVIGSGLKFKAEPVKTVLKANNVNFNSSKFITLTESSFNLYLNSKRSTNTRNVSFHKLAWEAKKQALIGGDCLVILDYGRTEDHYKSVNARIIDGMYIQNPINNINAENNNFISNGVEINQYGEPVAFWVLTDPLTVKRISAYTSTGTLQAFMVYGVQYRVDYYRGMPLLSAVLETIKKLDRYKEATVGSAEERAKLPWFVEHQQYSTGEDPIQRLKSAAGLGRDVGTEVLTNDVIRATASNIKYTTGKTTLNMPIGATLKSIDSKNDLYFKDFYTTNFEILCATVGIPPEVALNKYTSSFSSSRGANKNWEHKVLVERDNVVSELYQPFYNFWLETEIYSTHIKAPGYAIAKTTDNFMVIEAFQNCRFIGTKMPFIDPLKEVQAARAKLGDDSIPLATHEQVTEELNNGDWNTNIEQVQQEKELAEKMGFSRGFRDNTQQNNKENSDKDE